MATSIGPCAAPVPPPCPDVTITATAPSATTVEVTVTAGGPVTITLDGQTSPPVATGGSHTFTGLAPGKTYTATATSECGSVGVASAQPVCPPVSLTAAAQGTDSVVVTNTGTTAVDVELDGQIANGVAAGATHTFTNLAPGKHYKATASNSCGSASAVSTFLSLPVTYCPGYHLVMCGQCGDAGYGYFDNALRDPAATVQVTACDGTLVAWIYPTSGTTGTVRHEIPYYDGATLVGYMANQSDCASKCC